MRIVVKRQEKIIDEIEFPFSIGDIVKVNDYGCQYCSQKEAFKKTTLYNGVEFGGCPQITDRDKWKDWKIIGFGVFSDLTCPDDIIMRLISRKGEELIVQYKRNNDWWKEEHHFTRIRTHRNEDKEYIIRIGNDIAVDPKLKKL